MPCSVYLSVGESFAEATVFSSSRREFRRWALSKESLNKGLSAFLTSLAKEPVENILIETKLPQFIVKKRLGSTPAFLVTTGFENWLEINSPIKSSHFTVYPNRSPNILDNNLIFGISERTTAHGQIQRGIDPQELEFLIAKLEMNKIKQVVIGFLHATANPENEQTTARFFRERGFDVFSSHEVSHEPNEIPRWQKAVLTAYVWPLMKELDKEIRAALTIAGYENIEPKYLSSAGGYHPITASSHLLAFGFGSTYLLRRYLQKQNTAKHLLYLGLEEFLYLPPQNTMTHCWDSSIGPVSMTMPIFKRIKIQPTQVIERGFWNVATFSDQESGYEPGPMCLGKGLQPTFLDLLAYKDQLKSIEALSERIVEKSKTRILETLSTLSKQERNSGDRHPTKAIEWLLKQARDRARLHFDNFTEPLLIAGSMHELGKTWYQGPSQTNEEAMGLVNIMQSMSTQLEEAQS